MKTANRRYAIEFVSHWFYNMIDYCGRALAAPVADPGHSVKAFPTAA